MALVQGPVLVPVLARPLVSYERPLLRAVSVPVYPTGNDVLAYNLVGSNDIEIVPL